MALLTHIMAFMRRERALTAAIIFILVLPLLIFALLTPVRAGTITVCKYKHTIQDDTVTKWVWRWTAGSYKVATKNSICGRHKKLEDLWAKEQKARAKGDYKTADEILTAIKAADPTFPNVDEEQAAIGVLLGEPPATGGTPSTQPGTPAPPGNGQTPTPPSGDLSGFFPSALAGYRQVSSTNTGMNASRLYEADPASHPKAALLTIQLDQAGSEAEANTFINTQVKSYYAADAKSVSIDGTQAYFGTDGRQLAVLAYPVGGVVITLELKVREGAPLDLYNDLVALGKIVP